MVLWAVAGSTVTMAQTPFSDRPLPTAAPHRYTSPSYLLCTKSPEPTNAAAAADASSSSAAAPFRTASLGGAATTTPLPPASFGGACITTGCERLPPISEATTSGGGGYANAAVPVRSMAPAAVALAAAAEPNMDALFFPLPQPQVKSFARVQGCNVSVQIPRLSSCSCLNELAATDSDGRIA